MTEYTLTSIELIDGGRKYVFKDKSGAREPYTSHDPAEWNLLQLGRKYRKEFAPLAEEPAVTGSTLRTPDIKGLEGPGLVGQQIGGLISTPYCCGSNESSWNNFMDSRPVSQAEALGAPSDTEIKSGAVEEFKEALNGPLAA